MVQCAGFRMAQSWWVLGSVYLLWIRSVYPLIYPLIRWPFRPGTEYRLASVGVLTVGAEDN